MTATRIRSIVLTIDRGPSEQTCLRIEGCEGRDLSGRPMKPASLTLLRLGPGPDPALGLLDRITDRPVPGEGGLDPLFHEPDVILVFPAPSARRPHHRKVDVAPHQDLLRRQLLLGIGVLLHGDVELFPPQAEVPVVHEPERIYA